jgi:hypothetical protein
LVVPSGKRRMQADGTDNLVRMKGPLAGCCCKAKCAEESKHWIDIDAVYQQARNRMHQRCGAAIGTKRLFKCHHHRPRTCCAVGPQVCTSSGTSSKHSAARCHVSHLKRAYCYSRWRDCTCLVLGNRFSLGWHALGIVTPGEHGETLCPAPIMQTAHSLAEASYRNSNSLLLCSRCIKLKYAGASRILPSALVDNRSWVASHGQMSNFRCSQSAQFKYFRF